MKRHLTNIILTAGLSAVLGSLTLSAQDQKEVANIPFAFEASHQLMPAGEYTVSATGTNGLFRMSDGSGSAIYVAMIPQDRGTGSPHLTFRCSGDQRVLAEVWTPDGSSYAVSKSSLEKDLNRKLEMAALVSVRLNAR